MRSRMQSLQSDYINLTKSNTFIKKKKKRCSCNDPIGPSDYNLLRIHYMIDPLLIQNPRYVDCITQLNALGTATLEFLSSCGKTSWIIEFLAKIFRSFLSVTDTNGLLNRGQMFVLSKQHIHQLLSNILDDIILSNSNSNKGNKRFLDVGAGSGNVTRNFESYYSRITATEVSFFMHLRLKSLGYEAVRTPYLNDLLKEGNNHENTYDLVGLLNLLDRCDYPMEVLKSAHRLLKDDDTSRLLIAIVLPFSEFVEDGTKKRGVYEPLDMRGSRCGDCVSFEKSLESFITCVEKENFVIEKIARVPYLCSGDSAHAYYVLSDGILVFRKRKEGEEMISFQYNTIVNSSNSSNSSNGISMDNIDLIGLNEGNMYNKPYIPKLQVPSTTMPILSKEK